MCGFTAILLAAQGAHGIIVQQLIDAGANITVEDFHGRNLLHWATKYDTLDSLEEQLLKKMEVNISAADRWGRTLLMWAIECKQLVVASWLLDAEADIEQAAEDGSTPLHLAAFVGAPYITQELLEKDANLMLGIRTTSLPFMLPH